MAQNPRKMGYEAVKTAVQYVHGEPVSDVIDSGAMLLTGENLDSPAVKQLLGK